MVERGATVDPEMADAPSEEGTGMHCMNVEAPVMVADIKQRLEKFAGKDLSERSFMAIGSSSKASAVSRGQCVSRVYPMHGSGNAI